MENKLSDLNDHLFAQLERLNEKSLKPEKLDFEVSRSKALTMVSKTIIENATLLLEAKKHFDEYGIKQNEIPNMLQLKDK